ncbi:transferase [Halomonas sp. ML-15]|uniref:PglD-related sugar-binding protein n=1 Tax=Halomonas sp. ML-15 TaxID=2773305 RepID=UPI0017470086|nr:transferase [Halomonas sp. ML-15]MBD3896239.1 transferase [Halomonas sp. ML-15]
MKDDIYVIGVGPYTAVIIELAQTCGYEVRGLYHYNDERNGEDFHGVEIISSVDSLLATGGDAQGKNFALSMGNNQVRLETAESIVINGGVIPSLIHPLAEVSPSATIEEGVILKRNVAVQAKATIKKFSIVCDNSLICHHSIINEGCFVAGLCVVGAYLTLGRGVFIGQGAIVPSGKASSLGCFSSVGAGSVVIKDVAKYEVVAGNPARILRKNEFHDS